MSLTFIFTSGLISVLLVIIGLVLTLREFREMNQNPEQYRQPDSAPKIVDRKD